MKPQLQIFNYSVLNISADKSEVFIDGDILDSPTQEMYRDWWGDSTSVSYKSFREELLGLPSKNVDVYVNTAGGHIGDAMAMHDLIKDLNNKGWNINTIGRGIVASAGTYILMAGNKTSASKNTSIMIHNAQVSLYGTIDVDALKNIVDTASHFNDKVVNFYTTTTGLPEDEIRQMMSKETWMSADEALAKNFIKSVEGDVQFLNQLSREKWQYQNTAVLNRYNSFIQNQSQMNLEKVTSAIEAQFANMLEKLGIANKKEDASTKDVLNEFSTAITNAFKEAIGTPLTEDAVTNMVTKVLEERADADAKAIENAVKEFGKGLVNNEQLTTQITNLKTEIINSIGGKNNSDGKGGDGGEGAQKRTTPGNRFANRVWFQEN